MAPTCESFEAHEVRCDAPATHAYYWPGREKAFACYPHLSKLRRVADVMGFLLVTERLDPLK